MSSEAVARQPSSDRAYALYLVTSVSVMKFTFVLADPALDLTDLVSRGRFSVRTSQPDLEMARSS